MRKRRIEEPPRPPYVLRERIVGMPPDFRRLEGQDNLFPGHSRGHELLGDPVFRAVTLDPELAVDQVNVHQAAMDSATLIPARVHQ